MNEIYITKEELELVLQVIKENRVEGVVKLIYDSSSGIGSIIDMEFDYMLNNRPVTIRTNITDSDSW